MSERYCKKFASLKSIEKREWPIFNLHSVFGMVHVMHFKYIILLGMYSPIFSELSDVGSWYSGIFT